jgi:hypothetical protein
LLFLLLAPGSAICLRFENYYDKYLFGQLFSSLLLFPSAPGVFAPRVVVIAERAERKRKVFLSKSPELVATIVNNRRRRELRRKAKASDYGSKSFSPLVCRDLKYANCFAEFCFRGAALA